MNEETDILSKITSILEVNMGWVVLFLLGLIAICVYYRPIARYIDRTKNITFSEDGLKIEGGSEKSKEDAPQKGLETAVANESSFIEKQETWFELCMKAFSDGDIDEAKDAFRRHCQDQDDLEAIHKEKSFFLYLQFTTGKDMGALKELELHAKKAENEELKVRSLGWLSKAFIYDKQFDKAIELWKNLQTELTDISLKTGLQLKLSEAYLSSDAPDLAKTVLIQTLNGQTTDNQKAQAFRLLAQVEQKANNKKLSTYCLDKATQYEPENLGELFEAAHSAADSSVNELAILNYKLLTSRQPNNAGAWNNLGVEAKQVDLNIMSIQSYSKSSELGESLALSNKGYALLHAGFIDEAEELAHKAVKMEKPNSNVYNLLSDIEEKRRTEQEKLQSILNNASKKQSRYRAFIEKYYLGDVKTIVGDWITNDSKKITIEPIDNRISLKWNSYKGSNESEISAKFELNGEICGATFKGSYSKTHPTQTYSILGSPKDIGFLCLGYVDGDELHIFATSMDEQTTLIFKRNES